MNPKFGILGMLSYGEFSLGSKNPTEKSVLYIHHPSIVVSSTVPVDIGHDVKLFEKAVTIPLHLFQ
jgi:ribosomal protein L30E